MLHCALLLERRPLFTVINSLSPPSAKKEKQAILLNELAVGSRGKKLVDLDEEGRGWRGERGGGYLGEAVQLAVTVNDTGIFPNLTIV